MRLKPESECPQDCPGRSATCHATCEKHLSAWRERREQDAKLLERAEVTDYTVKEIMKLKKGRVHDFDRYRPKERRKG